MAQWHIFTQMEKMDLCNSNTYRLATVTGNLSLIFHITLVAQNHLFDIFISLLYNTMHKYDEQIKFNILQWTTEHGLYKKYIKLRNKQTRRLTEKAREICLWVNLKRSCYIIIKLNTSDGSCEHCDVTYLLNILTFLYIWFACGIHIT